MILDKLIETFSDNIEVNTFTTVDKATKILDEQPEFQKELMRLFEIQNKGKSVIQIGNAKPLIAAIEKLDEQCTKIDLPVKMKNLQLQRMLQDEKAIFEVLEVKDNFILKENRSDILRAETRYTAKHDILDYYHFSKFANYCRDNEFEDLVDIVKGYLKKKNNKNNEVRSVRVIHRKEDGIFFIRAFTSSSDYKNFGINFSALVALLSIGKYIESSKRNIYINRFSVDDSNLYVSFAFVEKFKVTPNLSLSFNLILENNEVKQGAVSFNGIFKLRIDEKGRSSEVYLKPGGLKKAGSDYTTDLLTYSHRGSVERVFNKISELPTLIEYFIEQVSDDAKKIISMRHPNDVKKYIADKIKASKKPEFKQYKMIVFNKLMSMNVTNTFTLFDLLRKVEDLFEHEDIVAVDFWRQKLYEILTDKK
jgi:hypothetical protein